MRTIGNRLDPPLAAHPSGKLLAEGARFSESIAHLARSTFVAKGVYRFKSHEEANRHEIECLTQGMARMASDRA
jgi:hypothetical protein